MCCACNLNAPIITLHNIRIAVGSSYQRGRKGHILKCFTPSVVVVKVRVNPRHLWAGTDGRWRYSTNPLQPVLREGWWSAPHSSLFNSCKRFFTHLLVAGWALELFGLAWKTSPPLGFDPHTIQPVANSYVNYAILAPVSVLAIQHYHIACNLFFHIFHVSIWGLRIFSPLHTASVFFCICSMWL